MSGQTHPRLWPQQLSDFRAPFNIDSIKQTKRSMDLGTFGVRRHLSVATESLTETQGKEKAEKTLKSWRRSWISRRIPGQEGEAGKENGVQGPQNVLGPSSSRANQTYVTFHQLLFFLLNHTSAEGQDTSPKMAKLAATPEEMDIFACKFVLWIFSIFSLISEPSGPHPVSDQAL